MFGFLKKKKVVETEVEKIKNKYSVALHLRSQSEPLNIICINESKNDLGEWLCYLLGNKKCFFSNLADGSVRVTKTNDVISMHIEDFVEPEEIKS